MLKQEILYWLILLFYIISGLLYLPIAFKISRWFSLIIDVLLLIEGMLLIAISK